MNSLKTLLREGEQQLAKAGIEDAKYDAWALLEFAFHIEKNYYFLHEDDKIEEEKATEYRRLLDARSSRIPLQHILGTAWFMGYEFLVNEHVLTPRFDTEVLVEEVSKRLEKNKKILDMCTGSGCILLSLMLIHPDWNLQGVGADLSLDALQIAKKNQERYQIPVRFIESNLFDKIEEQFDVIVSNPPYIASEVIETLMPEVREHEPRMALDGKEDGLYFYREIVRQAPQYLKEDGWLCFEIGYDQGAAVRQLLVEGGFAQVEIGKDLAGLDRTAVGLWRRK